MQEYKTFDKFCARFSIIVNYFYNLGIPISEEKYIKKINASLSYQFHAKVIMIESMYSLGKLNMNKLVIYLQVFELHHLLPRKEFSSQDHQGK